MMTFKRIHKMASLAMWMVSFAVWNITVI